MFGIYAENSEGKFKKAVLEAASYARHCAQADITAICIGKPDEAEAGKLAAYGVSKLIVIEGIEAFDPSAYTAAVVQTMKDDGITTLVVANTYEGKAIAPRIAAGMQASFASNVVALPETGEGFKVKRGVFSGKGFAVVSLERTNKVIAITPNSTEIKESATSIVTESRSFKYNGRTISIESTSKTAGKIPLTEAEVVVSAGRGMKGPENWGMIEELAEVLGAATACSKPVSDMGWRPHNEHVGQTGITIKPNLYIAIGISGAIQHLAGVSSSKVIVAINKDPEAPFFKAADYGIVGDAFEVVPQLIQAAKASNN